MKAATRLVLTADGSHSIYSEETRQHYHSVHGAWQESQRVFIELGLQEAFNRFSDESSIRIFEMGFGTGLNALLTAREAERHQRCVYYTAIEAYPVPLDEAHQLNFDQLLDTNYLHQLHEADWNQTVQIHPFFSLTKLHGLLQDFRATERFHLIYFDAFAPEAQPELWTEAVFRQMADILQAGGILTTYCSKGYVQRNLKAVGFQVEKHSGPAYKREIIRAVKPA
ncbi:tRNA 5-methylaminomethyl-2-thiouridine biosynthesis bifunctional protein mnmC Short=tRNA mnm(5)s(2)U biosynthesis bifunctional protein [Fibrisoma limi BUZ 3]|uniref:tRNA 5-methylaminomethyl-2-thiouridine biosynthesis bifunctional protein mnmC Short=tRNA mnm(5)s(2)U biosynthesis bifunctional protein n=1 Tax=Fibrisoma limi BUZ 3 TaxID=1185876 RepID=I2GSC9_9BACT|nr:tRNA (5-methylaminomethyl-2-thiouridine)(34)-methyltransferase MnmD [Fibrisoma limi]CCH56808.1 tRNA 5-methylaminomethyl-2-thiouridine biosynthesis bifunctional protein mnmC Short=tRNA mnm(5)s(2)U biosynthesis bifunctional protein [Fibrisoma limi BUZ 3]